MKLKNLAVIGCAALMTFSLASCGLGKSRSLGKPAKFTFAEYSEITDGNYVNFRGKVVGFASKFAASAYESYDGAENFAVSPVSVYMAMSLAAECAYGDTRTEILNALGVSYEQLQEHVSTLYRSLNVEYKQGNKITSTLKLGNSIWVNEGTPVNTSCIDALSNKYFAYSYSADFANDNENANLAIRHFVKEQTKGLIDRDFELSDDTLFALINTLYLKTIWNDHGDDLPFSDDEYIFKGVDGEKQTKLLQGYYKSGRVYEEESFSTFFTSAMGGYKIKFIVPKDGYGLADVFTAENISKANGITDYGGFDEGNNTQYFTRCFFPEFDAAYDGNVKSIMQDDFGVDLLFKSSEEYLEHCDFSSMTDVPSHCENIYHVTKLTVDKTGIEGAAVTVLEGAADGAPAPVEEVFADYIVDRAFGFVICDSQNVALFSGVVKNI